MYQITRDPGAILWESQTRWESRLDSIRTKARCKLRARQAALHGQMHGKKEPERYISTTNQ